MKLDPAIRIVSDGTANELTDSSSLVRVRTVRWKVGELGPYTDRFLSNEMDSNAVANRLNETLAGLRAAGIVKATEV